MRSQIFVSFTFLALAAAGSATETEYLGLYMKGAKVGYSSYISTLSAFHGKKVTKSTSFTDISLSLLGTDVAEKILSVTYVDKSGRPMEMVFDNSSNGRVQHVVADFGKLSALIKVNNTGTTSSQTLQIPKGANIVDDPMSGLVFSHAKIGHTSEVYILDPTTISFVKNSIIYKGKSTTIVHGTKTTAEWVQIRDPRAVTNVYCKANGDVIKIEAPLDFEMYPESKSVAMSKRTGSAKIDLAFGSKITPVGALPNPGALRDLRLELDVKDIDALPSDSHQTATKTKLGWTIDVHPPVSPVPSGATIAEAAKGREQWTKPDLNVPSREARFIKLAKTIIGGETDVATAAKRIQDYVYQKMQPDASIAVLRNANEVLDSGRGVCRDYAILTATLMRAAGIPARLATGLVSWDGDFYYHAWVSIYDGKSWVGVDSTTGDAQISAAHVELAVGSVSDAFTSPVLKHAVIKVVNSAS
jgi:hypothetical protein